MQKSGYDIDVYNIMILIIIFMMFL